MLQKGEPMDDLIRRQVAIDTILGQPPEPHYPSWYAEQIKELPPAEPQIIRCKDCNFWTKQKDSLQGRCALMGTYPTGNWFCGNAERRTE